MQFVSDASASSSTNELEEAVGSKWIDPADDEDLLLIGYLIRDDDLCRPSCGVIGDIGVILGDLGTILGEGGTLERLEDMSCGDKKKMGLPKLHVTINLGLRLD